MTDLPASWIEPSVPMNAERPSAKWLTATVLSLLSIYYHPDDADSAFEGMVAMWVDALRGLPKRAVEMAVQERIRRNDRRRPIPGEIVEAAERHIIRQHGASRPPKPAPFGGNIVPIKAARAKEIMAEVGESEIGRKFIKGLERIEANND